MLLTLAIIKMVDRLFCLQNELATGGKPDFQLLLTIIVYFDKDLLLTLLPLPLTDITNTLLRSS